jgi:uncharacterized membrane protein
MYFEPYFLPMVGVIWQYLNIEAVVFSLIIAKYEHIILSFQMGIKSYLFRYTQPLYLIGLDGWGQDIYNVAEE